MGRVDKRLTTSLAIKRVGTAKCGMPHWRGTVNVLERKGGGGSEFGSTKGTKEDLGKGARSTKKSWVKKSSNKPGKDS